MEAIHNGWWAGVEAATSSILEAYIMHPADQEEEASEFDNANEPSPT